MTYDKRFHRLFPTDLVSATAYYDRISIDLSNRFRRCVRNKLKSITERPESFAFVRKPLREAMIDGIPYLLLFQVNGISVYVAGLYHASSDPNRWLHRIGQDG